MKKKVAAVAALGVGAAVGAGLGILFAPKSGKETRTELKNKMDDLRKKVKEIDMEDVKDYVEEKINNIEESLKALDKETVKKMAKEKAKEIEKSCKDLMKYVKDKGEPMLLDAVDAVREKTIEVTKKVIDKLEA